MRKGLRVLAAAWALLGLGETASAESGCEAWAAKLVSAQGRVEVRRSGEAAWRPAGVGEVLCDGDGLHVAETSRAAVQLPSETILRLDQDTTLIFTATARRERSLLELLRGAVHTITRVPRTLEIHTPFVNAAVEGTEFLVRATDSEARVTVFEGRVRMDNAAGTLRLAQGESGAARAGEAPVSRIVVEPREAVRWAVHYPPVLDLSRADGPPAVRAGAARFAAGDLPGALAAMGEAPPGPPDADFFAYRASLLLYVGRVEAAEAAIARALAIAPDHGPALALKSIIALSRNDGDTALRLAREAAGRAPDSPAPYIALSYAEQARFDLEAALRAAQAAVERAPEDALAHARVAELQLAHGDLEAAEAAAQAAVQRNPNLSRTQTVLGYAYLLRLRPEPARKHFQAAIARDSADPLPRLGLGLARIRQGELAEGREQIEIAAGLDPTESLVRSYLGKAYYEERRDELATTQYALAKALDPQDPTPWFYDAILKQTTNRPVEALEAIQAAIERNDNRAVYRSELALDSDLAMRSASKARIYRDLGFEQLAYQEGYRSIIQDPTDWSGHRMLSDSYLGLPMHEVGRLAELLQSQLWAPLNMNPVQPQLGQTSLGVVEASGTTMAGLNEYSDAFVRDGLSAQVNLLAGGNETTGDDVVATLLHGGVLLSAGQFRYRSDGWRENADQEQDLYNLLLQVSPDHRTSLQIEYDHYDRERGDVQLRFDPQDYSAALRERREEETLRFGFRHDFSPRSSTVVSIIKQDYEERQTDAVPLPQEVLHLYSLIFAPLIFTAGESVSDATESGEPILAEWQQVYRGEGYALVGGYGYFDADLDTAILAQTSLTPAVPLPPFELRESGKERQGNGYLYATISQRDALVWQLGLSYDEYEGPIVSRSRFNPKFGIVWQPSPGTTVRAAAFRALKRSLVADRTIEPTQVAGFNQFFDDRSGTEYTRYGLGVDRQINPRSYVGVEATYRTMNVPYLDGLTSTREEADWSEATHRAYWYQGLSARWSLAVEYQYQRLEYADELSFEGVRSLTTQRLPVVLGFDHPSGVSVSLRATYYDQEGEFIDTLSGTEDRGEDCFGLVDLGLRYRLPRRYGFVSVEVRNLTDEQFNFQEPDAGHPLVYPERLLLGRLSLTF